MGKHMIEIDEIIMKFLKEKAEPFVDSPNSVLHKLLFGTSVSNKEQQTFPHSYTKNAPKALSQILEVIEEVVKFDRSRPEATRIVADRNGTAPQTIIDKYCRQLGKTASEVDMLLREPGLEGFRAILINRFPSHSDVIATFFNGLNGWEDKMEHHIHNQVHYHGPSVRNTTTYGSSSDRKKRDTALESALKNALGEQLNDKFGAFTLKGQSKLVFNGAWVLCKFSSFHDDQSRWFWGVSKIYWENWGPTGYLALIMENQDHDGYSFVILNSNEAQFLFKACSDSAGEKKINMRIYADDNVLRFQEWKEFDVETRTQSLDLE